MLAIHCCAGVTTWFCVWHLVVVPDGVILSVKKEVVVDVAKFHGFRITEDCATAWMFDW